MNFPKYDTKKGEIARKPIFFNKKIVAFCIIFPQATHILHNHLFHGRTFLHLWVYCTIQPADHYRSLHSFPPQLYFVCI